MGIMYFGIIISIYNPQLNINMYLLIVYIYLFSQKPLTYKYLHRYAGTGRVFTYTCMHINSQIHANATKMNDFAFGDHKLKRITSRLMGNEDILLSALSKSRWLCLSVCVCVRLVRSGSAAHSRPDPVASV